MNIAEVQDIVRSAIGGMQVGETIEGRERYPINVRFPRDIRSTPEKLMELPVITTTGAQVRLGDLAKIKVVDGPGMIRSENARLNGWVYVDIDSNDIGTYMRAAQEAVRTQLDMPAGYSLNWSGQFEFMERAKERLKLIVPFTLALIVIILFVAFRRVQDVALVLISLPLALSGGVWLLYLLEYNLSIAVAVGFIALAGVAVELSVVMIMFLNTAYKDKIQEDGSVSLLDVRQAVIEGALMRLRPIVMTVITIFAGLLPIMMGSGTGSEVMRRIAAPMVGGMTSAIILTVIVIPALYYIIHSRQAN
jgi:Cu(I)/Ag(I) efflux system membrane protein CusA/SilA